MGEIGSVTLLLFLYNCSNLPPVYPTAASHNSLTLFAITPPPPLPSIYNAIPCRTSVPDTLTHVPPRLYVLRPLWCIHMPREAKGGHVDDPINSRGSPSTSCSWSGVAMDWDLKGDKYVVKREGRLFLQPALDREGGCGQWGGGGGRLKGFVSAALPPPTHTVSSFCVPRLPVALRLARA